MELSALTVRQFCEKYATVRTRAFELLAEGALVGKKHGRRTLITASSARDWFENLPEARSAAR